MSEGEDAIIIKDLVKKYDVYYAKEEKSLHRRHLSKQKTVLDGIDLTVKKGEIVRVLGRNGSGKSTLLKIIAGIFEPTSGSVVTNGKVVSIMETGMGFQNEVSGLENIYLRGRYLGMGKKKIDEKLDEIIAYSELGDAIYSPIKMYSSGMRSRLAFAITINIEADIYILDEALSAGDIFFSQKSVGFMEKLTKKGKTILLTSHSDGPFGRMISRAILLENGKIAMDGSLEDATAMFFWSPYKDMDSVVEMAKTGNPPAQLFLSKKSFNSDYELYKEYLKKAAENGNQSAMIDYADLCIEEGRNDEAEYFLEVLTKDGNDEAMLKYAIIRSGMDNSQLKSMFKEMSEKGDVLDAYRYAEISRFLSVGAKSAEEVFENYSKAYENGNLDAGYLMATLMLVGRGTQLEINRSMEILKEIGEKGHTKSCYKIGIIYDTGMGGVIDHEAAFEWFTKAAKCGDAKAQFRVAMMCKNGIGTKVDEETSKYWLQTYVRNRISRTLVEEAKSLELVDFEHTLSREDLLTLAMDGYNGVAIDTILSEKSLDKSSKAKTEFSELCDEYCMLSTNRRFLGEKLMRPNKETFDEKEAFRQMSIAAAAGNQKAMYLLANMYRAGFGTEPDIDKYNSLIKSAARKNQFEARRIVMTSNNNVKTTMKCMSKQTEKLKVKHKKRV